MINIDYDSQPNIKLQAITAAVTNAPKPMRYKIVSSFICSYPLIHLVIS